MAVAPDSITRAAIHIELSDATIKSVRLAGKKAVWVIEVEQGSMVTTLPDLSTVQGEGYKAQVVIEAQYEQPVVVTQIDKAQTKLEDWTPKSDDETGDGDEA